MVIDSQRNFDVVKIPSEVHGDVVKEHNFEFGDIQNTNVLTHWKSVDDEGDTFESKLIELSIEEAQQLKAEVESIVSEAKPEDSSLSQSSEPIEAATTTTLVKWLINPTALAIAWPALGLILLAVDSVCDRIKWEAK